MNGLTWEPSNPDDAMLHIADHSNEVPLLRPGAIDLQPTYDVAVTADRLKEDVAYIRLTGKGGKTLYLIPRVDNPFWVLYSPDEGKTCTLGERLSRTRDGESRFKLPMSLLDPTDSRGVLELMLYDDGVQIHNWSASSITVSAAGWPGTNVGLELF